MIIKMKQKLSIIERIKIAWYALTLKDVLTWKDGIGQYIDDPRVQELTKKLCSEYSQKLYNPSNTVKNEQKSADKIEPKFNVGNWYQCTKDFFGKGVTFDKNTAYYCEKEGCLQDEYGCHIAIVKDLYDNFKLWTIKDAKDGDFIHLGTVTAIFKKYIGQEKCICYCSFCKDGGFEIPIENGDDNVYGCYNATPATKEQRDVLMKAMNDAGYELNVEKKELKKLISNRFDPKTLKPFDKVLIRRGSENYNEWFPDFVSEPPNEFNDKTLCMCVRDDISIAIPYNDDTKHLVGTTEEAPEYYRYWDN